MDTTRRYVACEAPVPAERRGAGTANREPFQHPGEFVGGVEQSLIKTITFASIMKHKPTGEIELMEISDTELSKHQILDTCIVTINIMSKHHSLTQALEEACRISDYPISFLMKNKILKIIGIIDDYPGNSRKRGEGDVTEELKKELELVKKGDYYGLKKMELDKELEIEKRISELEKRVEIVEANVNKNDS